MHVSLLATDNSDVFIAGDVQIHAGAAVASGVILQADPGAKIVIESGVCIGVGSVLHANGGRLVIAEGAILGAEVLLVGALTVGRKACIGAGSTVMNTAVAASAVIPPGSVLTEYETTTRVSFTAITTESTESVTSFTSIGFAASPQPNVASATVKDHSESIADSMAALPLTEDSLDSDPWGEESNSFAPEPPVQPPLPVSPVTPPPDPVRSAPPAGATASHLHSQDTPPNNLPTETKLGGTAIYGKVRVNKLLMTLLPHRQHGEPGNSSPLDQD